MIARLLDRVNRWLEATNRRLEQRNQDKAAEVRRQRERLFKRRP